MLHYIKKVYFKCVATSRISELINTDSSALSVPFYMQMVTSLSVLIPVLNTELYDTISMNTADQSIITVKSEDSWRKNLPPASAHWMLPGQTNDLLVSFSSLESV